jgi:hypothetical protein
VADTSGRWCAAKQPSDVWFLAGTFGGSVKRTCTIPRGRPLYFPILNQACTFEAGMSVDDATAQCASPVDEASATLDGTPLRTLEGTAGGAFSVKGVAGAPSFAGTKATVVTWGVWVGPVRLTPGRHVVHLVGRSGDFRTEVTYTLTAK